MSKASAYYTVGSIDGKHDIKELKHELGTLCGVLSVSVNEHAERIAVDFDTTGIERELIGKKIENLGYHVSEVKFENHIM